MLAIGAVLVCPNQISSEPLLLTTDVGSHCPHPVPPKTSACLILKPSDRERQKMSPPRIHSTDPAQPMKRAAPSSNLKCWEKTWKCLTEHLLIDRGLHLLLNKSKFDPKHSLLGNKEWVKEVSCDPVSIYGACGHGAEPCREKEEDFHCTP